VTVGSVLVFDTGPLRHFATAGWLGVLHFLAGDRQVLIPESVERELRAQLQDEAMLGSILTASWITVDRSDDAVFLVAFSHYEGLLAKDGRNRGECGVLALGTTRGFTIVLDDGEARGVAKDAHLDVTATLPLLCEAIRAGKLTVDVVESLADDLIEDDYYLPFDRGAFRQWATEEGLIDYR
jgi:predicted nucleic acid-binding protein